MAEFATELQEAAAAAMDQTAVISQLRAQVQDLYGLLPSGGDDTALVQQKLNTGFCVVGPGQFNFSAGLLMPRGGTLVVRGARWRGILSNMALLTLQSECRIEGKLVQIVSGTGTVGTRLGGDKTCQGAVVDHVEVIGASIGFDLLCSVAGADVLSNHIGTVRTKDCPVGMRQHTPAGVAKVAVNANHVGFLAAARSSVAGLLVDRADGNSFSKIHAENCTGGWGIDLVQTNHFISLGGWLEGNGSPAGTVPPVGGNLRIGDAVTHADIQTTADGGAGLAPGDLKLSHTHRSGRYIRIATQKGEWVYR